VPMPVRRVATSLMSPRSSWSMQLMSIRSPQKSMGWSF
jgi:hypothetical protein